MVDITYKSNTHRTAIAQAIVVVSKDETMQRVIEKTVPKGDVFEAARVAGLFAAKRTSDMIPDCHPLPIEYTKIDFEIIGLEIKIFAEIQTIYKTGVEVEAMHSASVSALTMYDMLKPIDPSITIKEIKLLQKKGGKSDFIKKNRKVLTAAVIVCSDSVSAGMKDDKAGKVIVEKLNSYGVNVVDYLVIPDEVKLIKEKTINFAGATDLLIFTGGTGLSIRDVTPESIRPLLDKEIPGIEEAIRVYGQERTPYSMLSRSVAGLIKSTLVLALPGSTRGASESMSAVFPSILHIFEVMRGTDHRNKQEIK